jgi:DNA-binding LacI/PurR family transcriptional regulator
VVLLLDPRYSEGHEAAFVLSQIEAGLQEGAAEQGATLCVGSSDDPQATLARAPAVPVKAVFLLAGSVPAGALAGYSGVPVVQLLTPSLDRPHPWDVVSQDNVAVGRHAAEYLLARGHERLCAISAVSCWPAPAERAMAFAACGRLARHEVQVLSGPKCRGSRVEGDPAFCQRHHIEVCESLGGAFLGLSPRPTGLFITSDATTAILYRVLSAGGLVIGKDVEVVSCNNDHEALGPLVPRPLTYDLRGHDIGRLAVQVAVARASSALRLPALRLEVSAVPVPPG